MASGLILDASDSEKYTELEFYGAGSEAVVFSAVYVPTGQRRALKVMCQMGGSQAAGERRMARFINEAKVLLEITHPNVSRAYELLDVEYHGRGTKALALEWLPGNLRIKMSEHPNGMPEELFRPFLGQAVSGMEALHGAGIAVRDIRPENLLLDERGTLKIGDLGMARTEETAPSLVESSRYMAPEILDGTVRKEAEGGDPGPEVYFAGDIYGLGMIFYEAVVGAERWEELEVLGSVYGKEGLGCGLNANDRWRAWHMDRGKELPAIRSVRKDVPEALAEVIDGMVRKDRVQRWKSLDEVRARMVGGGMEIGAGASPAIPKPGAGGGKKRRVRWTWVGGAMGVAVVAVIAVMMVRGGGKGGGQDGFVVVKEEEQSQAADTGSSANVEPVVPAEPSGVAANVVEQSALWVASEPVGAKIYLNGKGPYGETPREVTGIRGTEVKLMLRKAGYKDHRQTVMLKPGETVDVGVVKLRVSDRPTASGEMVFVPAGEFTMGGTLHLSNPAHFVYLDAFYIDKYEVTNAEFEVFIKAGGYSTRALWSAEGWAARLSGLWTAPAYWSSGDHHSGPSWPNFPVCGISWYEAEAYANFVGKRLPTEAEWEKAARGTDGRTYPWGEGIDGSRANYFDSGDPYDNGSTPVGFYDGRLFPNPPFQTTDSPGPYGAYDQAGNIWEWVKDRYSNTYCSESPYSNPLGPVTGPSPVLRGGYWHNGTSSLRCSVRASYGPAFRSYYIGFRCARTP